MKFNRASGILLHPTSLPGRYGIGDLGPQAHQWIKFLSDSGCSLWQVLPLGPTGYGDSPYQCFSAFAGNPYLVSPELLIEENLVHPNDLVEHPHFSDNRVDFGSVINWKLGLLDRAYNQFENNHNPAIRQDFDAFSSSNADWLNDYALFMALKEAHGGNPWVTWGSELRDREPSAIEGATLKYQVAIQRQKFRQFLFFRQWEGLRQAAHQAGISIIGDIPIFVAHDSADVWANPELFYLDQQGNPSVVAGVPPDYFSLTGQLWGNPLYRWDVHDARHFSWWISRMRAVLSTVDIVRLDHFRGFAAYWEVSGTAKTAEKGRWVPAPGKQFLKALRHELSDLPIIAEDLGVITPDVVELREHFDLPGMKILQFAFAAGPEEPFLPHNYPANCVVYTGTHDNDTVLGWYKRVGEEEKDFYRRYLARDGSTVSWDLIRASWASVAVFALAPMQDFLALDNSARMNYPGNPSGNWTWRLPADAMDERLSNRITEINYLYGRTNPMKAKQAEIDSKDEKL